jgi:meiotically up-regulated gene 157 (Mug157) protein
MKRHSSEITRRAFLRSTIAPTVSGTIVGLSVGANETTPTTSSRIAPEKRKFRSGAVEATLVEVKKSIQDPELAVLFENCFPNTLDTTVSYQESLGKPDTFVITGDIQAMWLRDSSAQVWPYLPLAQQDARLKKLLSGVINRQARCISIDPYANAFNVAATGSEWAKDLTAMKPELHERKWEIDSLCYPIRLAHGYWKTTNDTSCFDVSWQAAMALAVKTFKEQQRFNGPGPYRFERITSRATDTLPGDGYGNPSRPSGMIHSAFRPSDDACIFPYLIPSNLFAVKSLEQLAEISETVLSDSPFARECRELVLQVREGINKYGRAEHKLYGMVYAYEVDGFGNQLFMDDANVPNLLSLPYLGCCQLQDPVYQNTRRLVLSANNPYYFRGKAGEGVGSPHTGPGMIWPLGIIMQALTSTDTGEIRLCLGLLKSTNANTGFMHESFSKDDPKQFTRPWFAWANTLFGELILKLHTERPELLRG